LLGAAAWVASVSPAGAYVPPLDALYEQLVAGSPSVGSAIIDFQCRVFSAPPGDPAGQPVVDPIRGFRQRVYWQRGRLLAVETLAEDGNLLHVLLSEGGFTQAGQLSAARRFSEADVRPLIFPFLEGKTVAWTDELSFWGVAPADVAYVLLKTGPAYRLTDDPEKALWLDKEAIRPVKFSTRIAGGAAPLVLTVEFGDFASFATKGPEKDQLRIPRKVTYALNGRMFKEVRMTEFEVDPPARKFPLARLRQQAAAPPAARPQ
jgi:hypothetical protein